MGFSDSIFSYADVRGLLDRALAAERGIRVKFNKKGAAINLRQRMNHFRRLDRRENKQTYKPGDPLYDRSQYDMLLFKLKDEGTEFILEVVKGSEAEFDIEEME